MSNVIYFSGFFDGEGSISILPHSKHPKSIIVSVQVSQVDPRPLIALKEMFGGNICYIKNTKPNGSPAQGIWKWSVCHKNAETFLIAIQPYCIVKKEQIDMALKIRSLIQKRGGNFKDRSLSKENHEARISLMKEWKQIKGGI